MFESIKNFVSGAFPWVAMSIDIAFFAVYSDNEKDKEIGNEK